jgi:hypothetical protein
MMAGGFGYEDLSEEHIVDLAFISHLVSSIFLIIMTIITMNVMVSIGFVKNVLFRIFYM